MCLPCCDRIDSPVTAICSLDATHATSVLPTLKDLLHQHAQPGLQAEGRCAGHMHLGLTWMTPRSHRRNRWKNGEGHPLAHRRQWGHGRLKYALQSPRQGLSDNLGQRKRNAGTTQIPSAPPHSSTPPTPLSVFQLSLAPCLSWLSLLRHSEEAPMSNHQASDDSKEDAAPKRPQPCRWKLLAQ